MPNKNNTYEGVFVQIGLNKTSSYINTLGNDISLNDEKFKKGIEEYIDITINEVYLVFIFDKETQKNKSGYWDCVADYCLKK